MQEARCESLIINYQKLKAIPQSLTIPKFSTLKYLFLSCNGILNV